MLPLLQAVPLHIEATKNTLNDAVSKLALTQTLTSDSPSQSVAAKITGKRKRSQRSPSSSPLVESPSKRRDLTGNVLKDARPIPTAQSFEEKVEVTSSVHQQRPFELSSSSRLKNHTGSHQKSSSPLTRAADASSTSPLSRRNTFVLPDFSTPRKPLSDLLVQPSRQTTLKLSNTLVYGNSTSKSNTTMSRPSPRVLLDITPTATRPPRMPRVHASISNNIRNKPMEPSNSSTKSGPMNHFQQTDSDPQANLTFSGPDMSSTYKVLSPGPSAPFPSSRVNHSVIADPQDGPKTIPENSMPTLNREIQKHMPPPNQKVLSLESPTDHAKGRLIVPTAVALGNMQEAPVSWIVFFINSLDRGFHFWIGYRKLEEDLFRWLILKMRMKNSIIINISLCSYHIERNSVQWITTVFFISYRIDYT